MSTKFIETDVNISDLGTYWNDKFWLYKLKHDNLIYKKIKINHVEFFTVFSPAKLVDQNKLPKARILFIHGFAEYHKIYEEFFEDMSSAGYEVFFYDQRGAGLTSRGKFRGITNNHYTYKDVDNFIEYNCLKKDESVPLYIAGHSMGGGIVLNYLVSGKHRDKIKGGICCAPLVLLHPATKPSIFLEKLVIFVSKFKETILFDTKLDKKYFSTNEETREFLANDELAKPTGSIGQLRDMILGGRALLKPEKYKNFDSDKSLLIVHSKDDHINWYEGSSQFMQLLNKEFPESANKRKIASYDKLEHSLLLEIAEGRADVLKEIIDFLNKDLGA